MEMNKTMIKPEQASDKTLEEFTNKSDFDDFAEDAEIIFGEMKADDVIANFIEKYRVEFDAQAPDGSRYNPARDANLCKTQKQEGFFVYYAFPNGTTSPVASFWATQGKSEDGGARFKFIHIDFAKVMTQFIKYYKARGYLPPPPRENVKQSSK